MQPRRRFGIQRQRDGTGSQTRRGSANDGSPTPPSPQPPRGGGSSGRGGSYGSPTPPPLRGSPEPRTRHQFADDGTPSASSKVAYSVAQFYSHTYRHSLCSGSHDRLPGLMTGSSIADQHPIKQASRNKNANFLHTGSRHFAIQ